MVTSLLLGHVARKVAVMEDGLCIVDIKRQYHHGDVFFGHVDLAYDKYSENILTHHFSQHIR